ncbi:MAG: hypothetical protein JSW65_07745, partial [Candidatus Bipolaricaulota bacterium]
TRFRAGIRLDSFRGEGWRFQPYIVVAAVYSKIKVKLDSIDGAAPAPDNPPTYTAPPWEDTQVGALGRLGVEFEVGNNLCVDVAGNYEVLEFPTGTASISSVTGGIAYRI